MRDRVASLVEALRQCQVGKVALADDSATVASRLPLA